MADSREYRRQFWIRSGAFVAILVAILAVLSIAGRDLSRWKIDLTRDGLYTLSRPFKNILANLEDKVLITYYVSEKLPSFFLNLRRDTIDMFEEIKTLSSDMVEYEIIDPEKEAARIAREKVARYREVEKEGDDKKLDELEPKPVESLQDLLMGGFGKKKKTPKEIREERETRAKAIADKTGQTFEEVRDDLLREEYKRVYLSNLLEEGIQDIPFQEQSGSEVRELSFYSAIQVHYRNRDPETIPRYLSLNSLEIELAQRILKLTLEDKPKIAFFDARAPEDVPPPDPFNPQQQRPRSDYDALIAYLSNFFDVRKVKLKEGDTIEDLQKKLEEDAKDKKGARTSISCLIVAQPDDLEDRQVYEISKAVSEGIPTILLVSRHSLDTSAGPNAGYPIQFLHPGAKFDDLLKQYGLSIGTDVLGSNVHGNLLARVTVPGPGGNFQINSPHPFYAVVLATIRKQLLDSKHLLLNHIPELAFPMTDGITVDDEKASKAGIDVEKLAWTDEETWAVQVLPFSSGHFGRGASPTTLVGNHMRDLVFDMRSRRKTRDDVTFIGRRELALLMQGSFPFLFEGKEIPEWKVEEKDEDKDKDASTPPGPPGSGGPAGPQDEAAGDDAARSGSEAAKGGGQNSGQSDAAAGTTAGEGAGEGGNAPAAKTSAAAGAGKGESGQGEKAEEKKEEQKKETGHAEVSDKGRLLVLSSADAMKDYFLVLGQNYPRQCSAFGSNLRFFQNAIETFGLGSDLMELRSKTLTQTYFKPGTKETEQRVIQVINLGVVPVLVIVVGLIRLLMRRAAVAAYERQMAAEQGEPPPAA